MALIDYHDPRPVYEQIVDHYEKLILQGVLEKGEQMPSVRQMATELSINPNTIQKAFAILEKDGFIYTVRGRGNFVADCSELAKQRKELWLQDLEKTLVEGQKMGIDKEQCEELLAKVYGRTGE